MQLRTLYKRMATVGVVSWLVVLCIMSGVQETEAYYSRFVEYFLKHAVIESDLQLTFHVPGFGTVDVTSSYCTAFEATDIKFTSIPLPEDRAIVSKSAIRGLGLKCALSATVNQLHPIRLILDVRNGETSSSIKYELSPTSNSVRNVTMSDCSADFAFPRTSLTVEGVSGISLKVLEAFYAAFAPLFGPYVVDPLVCSNQGLFVEAANAMLHLFHSAKAEVKVPRNLWPNFRLLESTVKPLSRNSSLLLAPYDKALSLKLISTVLNDLVGAKPKGAASDSRDIVFDKVVRQKLSSDGSGTVFFDFPADDGLKFASATILNVPTGLYVTSIRLTNLDTFRTLQLFKPISKLTLNHTIVFDGPIDFEIGLRLALQKDGEEPYRTSFIMKGTIAGIRLNALTLVALDHDQLFKNSTNLDNFLPCLLSAFAALEVPKLEFGMDVAKSSLPKLEPRDDDPFPKIVQSMFDVYLGPFIQSINLGDINDGLHLFAWYVSPLISTAIRKYHHCPPQNHHPFPPLVPDDNFVNMTMFPMTGLDYFVNSFLSPPNDPDFSFSRILEIIAQVLSFKSKNGGPSLGAAYLVRDDTLTLGPKSLLGAFPTLKDKSDDAVEPSISFSIGNVTVGPLNDVDFTNLFRANSSVSAYYLQNQLRMNENSRLRIKFDFGFEVIGLLANRHDMTPQFTVDMEIQTVDIMASIFARLNFDALAHLSFEQVLSTCVAFVFPLDHTMALDVLRLDVETFTFKMKCAHGGQARHQANAFAGSSCSLPFTQDFVDHISTKESNAAMVDFIRKSLPKVSQVLSGRDTSYFEGFDVPKGTDHLISDMRNKCLGIPHAPPKKVQAPAWIPPMRYVMLISALCLIVQFVGYMYMVHINHKEIRRRQSSRLLQSPLLAVVQGTALNTRRRSSAGSTSSANVQQPLLADTTSSTVSDMPARDEDDMIEDVILGGSGREELHRIHETPLAQMIDSEIEPSHVRALLFGLTSTEDSTGENVQDVLYLLGLSKPLIRHPGIHLYARVGIAVLLLVNFIIFVIGVSFFTMGAIAIVAKFGSERLKEIPMMSLTLDTCIDMMVEGRALLFALFIGGSSGIFPWIRVALLSFVWLAPPTILPVDKRGRIVENLESLGKWSLAEVYLFTVLMSVISVEMTTPSDWTFLLPGTFKADVECMPKWGLFIFLVATWVSLLLNHAIVHFHRQALRRDLSVLPSPPAMKDHHLQPLKLYRPYPKLTSALLLIWPICLILALVLDTLSVRFLGFSGFGIDMMKKDSTKDSTLSVSLSSIFPLLINSDRAHSVNSFGLFLICFGYALFILIAPAFLCIVSMVAWFSPLKVKHQVPVMNTLRVLNAWSTLEVLMCTIVVIVLQLHRFFSAMSGMITFLPDWMGPLLHDFGASDEEATGFGVKATLDFGGFVWLFAAAAVGNICSRLVYDGIRRASPDTSTT